MTFNINDEYQQRLEKRKKIKEFGIELHPAKFLHKKSSAEVLSLAQKKGVKDTEKVMKSKSQSIVLAGRMMTYRSHGKISFAQLQDFEGRIQIAFLKGITKVKGLDENKLAYHKFWDKLLDIGDYLGVAGELFQTKHGEITLLVKELTFLGKALRPLPEKFHGLVDEDIIFRQRYLDTLINEKSRKRFKFRSDLIKSMREFMWLNNFLEVETPSLEKKATGAAAKPYYTHNNALDLDLVLRISQELPLKKIILGGFEKIFEIGKAFRNEGVDPSHLPEHTHFEWYTAYWSYEENMNFVEEMIKHVIKELGIKDNIPVKDKDGKVKKVNFAKKWQRINYVDLIKKDSGIDINKVKELKELKKLIKKKKIKIPDMNIMSYATLVDYLYKKVSRSKIIGPAFLYNYPKAIQPLARTNDDNEDMVDQFQLVINGWEIIKGYSELVDSLDQKERFKEQDQEKKAGDKEAMEGDDDYILAMEYGMPPISGVGLGIDRLITILAEQDSLRDTVFFPLMRPKKDK